MPSRKELKMLQNLPLNIKIMKSKQRIREAINNYDIYISYSGGKDSEVLRILVLEVAKEFNKEVPTVFCSTGLQYRKLRKRAIKKSDITLYPEINFKDIVKKYGYPIVSKEQSQYISQYKNANSQKTKDTRWNGNKYGRGKISEKWKYLVEADFDISDRCCYYMKKKPFKKYENKTGKIPFIGKLAEESDKRMQDWMLYGCNAFDNKRPTSNPLSFWTNQDILKYIYKNKVKIAKEYGEVKKTSLGYYYLTGVQRTGCTFCGYGAHMEGINNRFIKLKDIDKELYEYVIYGGEYENGKWVPNDKGLGMWHVLDVYGVNYEIEQLNFL